MAGRKPARLSKLYLNAGTYASPTWSRVDKVEDVDIDMGKDASELNTRETPNTKTLGGGQKKIGIKFSYFPVDGQTDAIFNKLEQSYWQDTCIDIAAMPSAGIAVAGTKGIRGPFLVTKFDRKEPAKGPVKYDCELQETDDYSSDGATAYYADTYTVPS
jgi:hypothetical protein